MSLKKSKLASLKDKIEALAEKKAAEIVEPAEGVKPRKSKKDMQKGNSNIVALLAAGLVLVVALGVTYFGASNGLDGKDGLNGAQGQKGVRGEIGLKGDKGDRGLQGLRGLPGISNLGAVVSPNFQGPCVYYNGVKECSYEAALGQSWSGTEGTTTFYSIDPTRDIATSSLKAFGCNVQPLATTTFFEFGSGNNTNATTSRIGTLGNIDAGTGQTIVGSSTVTQSIIFSREAPGYRYFNLGASGGTNGTLRPTGACNATFRELVPRTGGN